MRLDPAGLIHSVIRMKAVSFQWVSFMVKQKLQSCDISWPVAAGR